MPVLLLDGFGLIFRSYFAFIHNPLRNAQGRNSSAIFGFSRMLMMLLKNYPPERVIVAFESVGPTWRHQEYPEYKITRDRTPEDLIEQIPIIEKILRAVEVPIVFAEGYEADDVIATYSRILRKQNQSCTIVTSDKDIMQLIDDYVTILYPSKGELFRMDRAAATEKWGIPPEQLLDYLSLVGDTSDNVPGVAGIGPKTTVTLLKQFHTLDGIYENIASISSKSQQTKLTDGKKSAYLSKKLITLKYDAPVPPLAEIPPLNPQWERAIPILREEGMQSLIDEIRRMSSTQSTQSPQSSRTSSRNKAARNIEAAAAGTQEEAPEITEPFETHETRAQRYTAITDIAALDALIAAARKAGCFAFDSETTHIDAMEALPLGFSIAIEEDSGYYIPLRGPDGIVLPEDEVRERLRTLLTDSTLECIGQNIKYDYKVLFRWGIKIEARLFDTMIAAWLIDTTANSYGLDTLAEKWLRYKTIHYRDLFPAKPAAHDTFDSIPLPAATSYAAEDADITLRLATQFRPLLAELRLEKLMEEIEMPLIPVLASMELEGIRVDKSILGHIGEEFGIELAQVEQTIYRLCGKEFNINSPVQLQKILFDDLRLPHGRKTKTGYSTDINVLTDLALHHEVPVYILRHRLLKKLKSTYIDALPTMINETTGRIHTIFNLHGTATGRISSTDPNLQNIPIKDEEGRRIRTAFLPRKGWHFISADYSQIELAILAHLSNDPVLTRALKDETDIHRVTGSHIFGVAPDDITPSQRRIAKCINFGVVYGMSAFRLARDLKISHADANAFLKTYFATYPKIQEFISRTIEQAEQEQSVRTILGRRRPLPDINNRNKNVKAAAERIAINTPVQGSAADVMKRALLRIFRRLREEKLESRLLLQVHDELIIEVPPSEKEHIVALISKEMCDAIPLSVPLRINIEVGDHWGAFH